LHYICRPIQSQASPLAIEFLSAPDFLTDEPACKQLWELIHTQFHTRSKFLAIWSGVRFVAVHRANDGSADGFLLVNSPVNWQIDYVVVRPDARGQGIAAALVIETLNQAVFRGVPYVMLTSTPALRPLYEGCGFMVIEERVGAETAPPPDYLAPGSELSWQ